MTNHSIGSLIIDSGNNYWTCKLVTWLSIEWNLTSEWNLQPPKMKIGIEMDKLGWIENGP